MSVELGRTYDRNVCIALKGFLLIDVVEKVDQEVTALQRMLAVVIFQKMLKFFGEDRSNEDLLLSEQERVSKLEEVTEVPPIPLKLTTVQTISSNSSSQELSKFQKQ